MLLSYTDIFDGGKTKQIKGTVTTEHSASSHGMPVVILDDGELLAAQSWMLCSYQVVSMSKDDAGLMSRWIRNVHAMMGVSNAAAELGRKGGSVSSAAKSEAAKKRENPGLKKGREALKKLTPEQRSENARKAARARWDK